VRRRWVLFAALALMLVGVGAYVNGERQRLLNGELSRAADRNDTVGMERAIARGADANGRFTYPWPLHNYSYSVLAAAVLHDRLKAAEYLLRRGASPNATGRWREPVLSIARKRKNGKMIRLLLRYGARE
jgi:hypothetical protein